MLPARSDESRHDPWLDTQRIPGGAIWTLEIEEAVEQSGGWPDRRHVLL
jgi:hypothetical protein